MRGKLRVTALAVVAFATGASASPAGAVDPPSIGLSTSSAVAQLAHELEAQSPSLVAAPTWALAKLDSSLVQIAASRLGTGGAVGAAVTAQRQGIALSAGGDVPVDVYVRGDLALAAARLRALGMRVSAISEREPQRMVEGLLPPSALPAVAALGTTRAIMTSAFASAHRNAPLAGRRRHRWSAGAAPRPHRGRRDRRRHLRLDRRGRGRHFRGVSQAAGDLPANVLNLLDDPVPGGTDEGRERWPRSIYDEAPGITGAGVLDGRRRRRGQGGRHRRPGRGRGGRDRRRHVLPDRPLQ